MADNLRITTPINNVNSNSNVRIAKEPTPLDLVNTAKVTNPNANEKPNGNAEFDFMLNRNSVFAKFLQQMQGAPPLAETLKKVMQEIMTKNINTTNGTSLENLLGNLADTIKMSKEDILNNLIFQNDNNTKFSGKMFDLLRTLANSNDKDVNLLLGRFLKSYDGYFSIKDTLNSVLQNLNFIKEGIPRSYSQPLQALIEELVVESPSSSLDLNLTTIKEKIIPFLSKYISDTNDFGRVRDNITSLINNLAKLNTSSLTNVTESLESLLEYCKYYHNLSDKDADIIRQVFAQTITEPEEPSNKFFEALAKTMTEGSKPEQSNVSRGVYKDIATTLLLDKSVYMPFTHIFLPVNYKGTFMFTEIWIDKGEGNGGDNGDSEKGLNLFLNFDIKNLGYFEAKLNVVGTKVSVELNYPTSLGEKENEISKTISTILATNGFLVDNLFLSKGAPTKKENEVFAGVFGRRNVVDVTV